MSEHISVAYPWARNREELRELLGWIPHFEYIDAAEPPAKTTPTENKSDG